MNLAEERQRLTDEARAILDTAEREDRDLTADEDREYQRLDVQMDYLHDIERRTVAASHRSRGTVAGGREGMEGQSSGGRRPGAESLEDRWLDEHGREVRMLRGDQRISDMVDRSREPLSLGKYVKGLVTGDWANAKAEQRAMSEGTLSAGGYAVPTPLAAGIIDRARNQAVCFQAGALTVPMESQTLKMARLITDPTVAWKSENAAITASDAAFDNVVFTAQVLTALVKQSVELFEDATASQLDSLITTTLGKVLGLELDRVGLEGTGTPPQPKGIRNQTGVGVDATTFGTNGSAIAAATPAGAVAWDWLSKTIYTVRGLNEYPNAAIFSERTGGELDLLRTTTGSPLPPPISVAGGRSAGTQAPGAEFSGIGTNGQGVQLLSTNAISNAQTQGSSSVASNCYVGDFTKLMFGLRTSLVLEISRTAADATNSAFGNLQVWIRAYLRADVQLMRPAAFRVVLGIL